MFSMNTPVWRAGRLWGCEILIDAAILLPVGLIVLQFADSGVPVLGLIVAVLLFGSVLLHEFGHVFAAKSTGLPCDRISLGMLGGLAHLGGEPRTIRDDLYITLAGPAVTLALWLVGKHGAEFIFERSIAQGEYPEGMTLEAIQYLGLLGMMNGYLLLFNLLPAYPLDGGRVLASLLETRQPRGRAMYYTSIVARVAAAGLVVWELYESVMQGRSFSLLRIFIAVQIWQTASNMKYMDWPTRRWN